MIDHLPNNFIVLHWRDSVNLRRVGSRVYFEWCEDEMKWILCVRNEWRVELTERGMSFCRVIAAINLDRAQPPFSEWEKNEEAKPSSSQTPKNSVIWTVTPLPLAVAACCGRCLLLRWLVLLLLSVALFAFSDSFTDSETEQQPSFSPNSSHWLDIITLHSKTSAIST